MIPNGYFIDVMLTKRCNFRCTYCYEHDYSYNGDMSEEVKNKSIDFIKKIYKWSNNKVNVQFWGGEPTLKIDYIKEFTELLKDIAHFAIFTNGYNIDKYKDFILECKEKNINFFTQISYDYSPNQEINRICPNHDKEEVKNKILDNIYWFAKNKLEFQTKSTINVLNLPNIYDVYMDFKNIQKNVLDLNPNNLLRLNCTLDTCNMPKNEEFEKILKKFSTAMSKIIAYQIKNKEIDNYYWTDFNWTVPNKSLCSVGYNILSINIDGNLYRCHGGIFSKKDHHKHLTNIYNTLNIENLFRKTMFSDNKICKKCNACFCMRCNVHSCDRSKLKKYDDKMSDFAINDIYCKIYKEISNFIYAKYNLNKGVN